MPRLRTVKCRQRFMKAFLIKPSLTFKILPHNNYNNSASIHACSLDSQNAGRWNGGDMGIKCLILNWISTHNSFFYYFFQNVTRPIAGNCNNCRYKKKTYYFENARTDYNPIYFLQEKTVHLESSVLKILEGRTGEWFQPTDECKLPDLIIPGSKKFARISVEFDRNLPDFSRFKLLWGISCPALYAYNFLMPWTNTL